MSEKLGGKIHQAVHHARTRIFLDSAVMTDTNGSPVWSSDIIFVTLLKSRRDSKTGILSRLRRLSGT